MSRYYSNFNIEDGGAVPNSLQRQMRNNDKLS